jgi:uncharacterized membrane protein
VPEPPPARPAVRWPDVLRGLSYAAVIVACVVIASAWSAIVMLRHHFSSVASIGTIAQIGSLQRPAWLTYGAIALAVAVVFLLLRRRELANGRAAGIAAAGTLVLIASTLATSFGHFLAITAIALIGACTFALHLSLEKRERAMRDPHLAGALWLLVTIVMAIFALHRHWAFGSGSWDMGCMVHNFYRASRFMSTISTVLGEVDFLGDHFMAGIYLYAPIFWIAASGTTLILIQCVNLAAVAPAIFLIARKNEATRIEAVALALCAGLSFGMQSAAYFDSHEITVGFGFLAFGLWAFEEKRLRLATALLAIFMLFKESLGAYVVALGMLAIWRGVRDGDRSLRRYGLSWMLLGAVYFVIVNRVIMPALIARANAPEAHETFGDFGPTVFSAMIGVLKDPLKAIAGLFVPDDKIESQLVTLGGVGWLALASPEILIAAGPLVAERFLSSKQSMWEMGYHYAAPLSLYAAWAAAIGWPRIKKAVEWLSGFAGGERVAVSAPQAIALYLVLVAALINGSGYRHPANFHRWEMDYFSTPERRESNRHAVEFLRAQGRDAKLAVQNRILPHLADREHIWRIGDWHKADWVLVSIGENAWPWDDDFGRKMVVAVSKDPEWKLVFAEKNAIVFARKSVTELPAIDPPPNVKAIIGN